MNISIVINNGSSYAHGLSGDFHPFVVDDAAWALTCSFVILTMQTGFAMLECGCVSIKNTANIMIKNVCDVCVGGLAFWAIGYTMINGKPGGVIWGGLGDAFFTERDPEIMGERYAHYFFHFSFASTATTIVSGAVAERMTLASYMLFAFANVIIYCLPAYWAWGENGFLRLAGFYDYAGVTVVHLNGGASALVATLMLGERTDRFTKPHLYEMSSPVTALVGMFMLMWAWLGFNCGSTFRSSPEYWKISALVAVTTLNGAIGGGLSGLGFSILAKGGKIDVEFVINSILGGLVSITGGCSAYLPAEAIVIGFIGGSLAIAASIAINRWKILDDPVGAIPVHFVAAIWGTLAVGIVGRNPYPGGPGGIASILPRGGLIHEGSWGQLGINTLALLVIGSFSAATTAGFLFILDITMGIRMSLEEEEKGADASEHNIKIRSLVAKFECIVAAVDPTAPDFDSVAAEMKKLLETIQRERSERSESSTGEPRRLGHNLRCRTSVAGENEAPRLETRSSQATTAFTVPGPSANTSRRNHTVRDIQPAAVDFLVVTNNTPDRVMPNSGENSNGSVVTEVEGTSYGKTKQVVAQITSQIRKMKQLRKGRANK